MNKTFKHIVVGILVIVLLLSLVFWGRISGAFQVYHTISRFTNTVTQGAPDFNWALTGSWGKSDQRDSLEAVIQFQKDEHFSANIKLNQKNFVVQSDARQTRVHLAHSALLLIGDGSELQNFDLFKMVGEICENHPKLAAIPHLTWLERLGMAGWALINCDFYQQIDETGNFNIIEFPADKLNAKIVLWWRADQKAEIRVTVEDTANSVKLKIENGAVPFQAFDVAAFTGHRMNISRRELNTAIYRGAIRAVGILLENAIKPETDGIERSWGKGKLSYVDGNRVLLAQGNHRELGEAHGALLKNEVRKMVDATLYTICWFYTMERKRWFLDDMRGAYQRLEPYIPTKYQDEMAGLAKTSGISLDEIRLTNVFPALFHCSGFALFGDATIGGRLLHGRILDYMTELGLQYHAVVYLLKPDGSHAFANIGYAGFIGSVSGMNEHQVAFGEMGGRGEGDWDGMPMAFLVREGLEKAATLEEALTIFRETPRTCEYYYVISDGKIPDARGLSTSPKRFEVIRPNQYHAQLQHPIENSVLMSAGDRYNKLAERVKANYGKIDVDKAMHLMDRPVAMKSDLHNVLFAPQTLEFWVANAGAHRPACFEPYSHYSFKELLGRLAEKR